MVNSVDLFTVGFTKLSAKKFFTTLSNNDIELLIDIRLNNTSQLAGFSKGDDLEYFLNEICKIKYTHDTIFAPSAEILDDYKKNRINWFEYENRYIELMKQRKAVKHFIEKYSKFSRICLLCSEPIADKCHRRLLAEEIMKSNPSVDINHL